MLQKRWTFYDQSDWMVQRAHNSRDRSKAIRFIGFSSELLNRQLANSGIDAVICAEFWKRVADAALIVVSFYFCRESSLARVMQNFKLFRCWSHLLAWLRKPSPCQVGLHVLASHVASYVSSDKQWCFAFCGRPRQRKQWQHIRKSDAMRM